MFPWISFFAYIIIMVFTPGPNNIMSMINAQKVGFKKGLPFNAGILAGDVILMSLCLIFSSGLYKILPKAQFPMKIAGGAYMVYLALRILFPGPNHEKHTRGSFPMGIIITLMNPKAYLFGITVMSSYVLVYYTETGILLVFVLVLSLVLTSSTIVWALCSSFFSKLFTKQGKILNILMALLLLYCAVSLFV